MWRESEPVLLPDTAINSLPNWQDHLTCKNLKDDAQESKQVDAIESMAEDYLKNYDGFTRLE